jgi:hypothetical protein
MKFAFSASIGSGIARAKQRKKLVVTHFDSRSALSIPKNAGRRGLYNTFLAPGSYRGRPILGRAVFSPIENQAV